MKGPLIVTIVLFLLFLSFDIEGGLAGAVDDGLDRPSTRSGDPSENLEMSVLCGYVFDPNDKAALSNQVVELTGLFFIGNSTMTDDDGWYSLNLPQGELNLTVLDGSGVELYRTTVSIGFDVMLRRDLPVDPSARNRSVIRGMIMDHGTGDPMEGVSVRLRREQTMDQVTTTGSDGRFEFRVTAGTYTLESWIEDRVTNTTIVEVHWGDDVVCDFSIEDFEKGEGRSIWERSAGSLIEHWYSLLGMVFTMLVCLVLFNLAPVVMRRISNGMKPIYQNLVRNVVRYIRVNIVTLFIVLEVFLLGTIVDLIEEYLWGAIYHRLFDIFFIIFVISLVKCLRVLLTDIVDYVAVIERSDVESKGAGMRTGIRKLLTIPTPHLKQAVPIVNFIILVIGIMMIIGIAVSSLGANGSLMDWMTDFISENMNYIYFIVIVVLIAWLSKRMIRIIFENLAQNAKDTHPGAVRLTGKVITGFVFAFAGMIILVAILQMADLSDISTVILSLAIVSIGLVTAMAATGGINNLITGMAVKSFLQLEVGDRIQIGDKLGDVVDISNIGIRIRNPKGEVIVVPHNDLFNENLINLTKSAPLAIAVEVTIGYDAPHEDVERLLIRAANDTVGVLSDPAPRTLLLEMEDSYIRYQLRAYVIDVKHIPDIKSQLIRNCHHLFYENGIEIASPVIQVERPLMPPTKEEMKDFVIPRLN